MKKHCFLCGQEVLPGQPYQGGEMGPFSHDTCGEKAKLDQEWSRKHKGIKRAKGLKGVEHWCANCDGGPVHSDKPESGSFYRIYGHILEAGKTVLEDFPAIVWAVCSECDKD